MQTPANCVPALIVVAAIVTSADSPMGAPPPHPAVPAEPITVIVDAVRSRPLVALSEGQHWNEQGHRFRLALIRDRRFAAAFNDIVVEFGNARY